MFAPKITVSLFIKKYETGLQTILMKKWFVDTNHGGGYSEHQLFVFVKWFPSSKKYRFYFDDNHFSLKNDMESDNLINRYYETTDMVFAKFVEEF